MSRKKRKSIFRCPVCGEEFFKLLSQISTPTPCCSKQCFSKKQKDLVPYERTLEHREKMSFSLLGSEVHRERASATFIKYNLSKKGKTFLEIYGEAKAQQLHLEASNRLSGQGNPNYIDGRSYEPYPIIFNKQLKETIKKRDGFICVKCDLLEDVARAADPQGRGLTIHHIDFNKQNCRHINLITTCRGCNTWSNYHRDESKFFYRYKITKGINFIC